MKKETDPDQLPVESQADPTDAFVRVGPLMSVPALLRQFDCSPERILGDAGLKLEQFEDPDTKISFLAGSKMLAHCVAATSCQHFGLLMGKRAGSSSLGLAGFILRFAPNVSAGLQALLRHLELHDQGGVPVLNTHGVTSSFGYAIYLPGIEAADQIYDLSTAMACNIMRDLCGQDWNPTRVLLARRCPTDLTAYKDFFRAPLRFDAEQNAVVFPTDLLDHTLTSADPALFRHLQKEADEQHDNHPLSTTETVHRLLRQSLASGHFTANSIAKQLGMHERTLHRHLEKEGTSFRSELEGIRYGVARQLLSKSKTPISGIANALGYTEASTFIRSFKRWSGTTPALWRSHDEAPQFSD
jgi:AraC-like DNA-binding protein